MSCSPLSIIAIDVCCSHCKEVLRIVEDLGKNIKKHLPMEIESVGAHVLRHLPVVIHDQPIWSPPPPDPVIVPPTDEAKWKQLFEKIEQMLLQLVEIEK